MKLKIEDLKRIIREEVSKKAGILDAPTFDAKVKKAKKAGIKKPEAYVATALRNIGELKEDLLAEVDEATVNQVFKETLASAVNHYQELTGIQQQAWLQMLSQGPQLATVIERTAEKNYQGENQE